MSELQDLLNPKYKNIDELPYRQGAIGIIIDNNNHFLIVQMKDYGDNDWRFSGGGIEENETPTEGLLRELTEELGTDKFEILKESKQVNKYDWPEQVIINQIKNKKRYFRGQEQHQFLVKFTGVTEDIVIDPKELKKVKWVAYNELQAHFTFDNQWEQAKEVLQKFVQSVESNSRKGNTNLKKVLKPRLKDLRDVVHHTLI